MTTLHAVSRPRAFPMGFRLTRAPPRHTQIDYRPWLADEMTHRLGHEPCLAAPIDKFRIGKAEMAMCVFLAQKFQRMRREIDDHQPSVRAHHARRFGDGGGRTIGVMQHLVEDRRIETLIGERQLKDVALPDRALMQIRLLEIGARHRQHFTRQIDADRARSTRGATISSMRAVPVPRSSKSRMAWPPSASSTAASTLRSSIWSERI